MVSRSSATRLGDLAKAVGAKLLGDPETIITGVGTLQAAKPGELSFLSNASYRRYLATTRASAVILHDRDAAGCPVAALVSDNPYLAYARTADKLFPRKTFPPGIDPSAAVDQTAIIDDSAWIGPCSVIGEGVRIESGVYLGPGCVVEENCSIGADSRLVANVTLCRDTDLGQRCLIHPGAVLGADGFGLANDEGRWIKVPQLGRVRVGDDVEIGANTTIDRGALEDTVLHDGVKLDNLIQIAHNVEIGRHTAMAGCSAVAGSTKIGEHCTIGGQTGLVGHLTIGDNVHFSAATLVTRSFTAAGYYSGNLPAMENAAWRRVVARLRKLESMARDMKFLKKTSKRPDEDR
ncbi:MAG: UDP-3-O-(3-hydroxymyristoyl)glucosamine N-acyltransferase [gamma proteobacterium symbiont of Ctena orbiculata]|uniref:UDP-3-O-acylglucosamine N-acyltransferase n=1 Tax=Candidatus Thiodiazotropha taylori TaxID=2792791 RepID=A0A944M997_9GAMM|nr:UDP-3-O-(3-hydroxymyristoyl)glucosamine N-acyltransferase [Candidatus Thiodiazotropha taylori]PUB82711.1 MAG: UDP-3-O-(3-hydroxymyristoyl)glucosamine N-acyltransferase [gamma proteobacterium symbiont of Ctena orbiculata]MBT3027648.1 UDP-3-O-(3-hydroxymyristoyl)glucosamine N-acyltransferase [Candidatus Thiodiazotropha taylori]MBT3035260.1 UDP-3-O-(3-hydroxymyristoyl)glucosamine N-acyltransferase [Candidatus Thiodiazotropha taylori]MBV2136762.1 UDP-3-O-(3-hydroxymyristoyl)glucosamine N-acyltra